MTANPSNVRRFRTMRRLANADAEARYLAGRRRDARAHGYRGPLTREEASAMALQELAELAQG